MATEGALLCATIVRIEMDRIIRTGIATGPAPDAFISVNKDNAIRSLVDGPFYRAGLQTGRILTVHAGVGLPGEAESRVSAHGYIRSRTTVIEHLHPRACLDSVFDLAGNHTGAATDASLRIK